MSGGEGIGITWEMVYFANYHDADAFQKVHPDFIFHNRFASLHFCAIQK
jgi:hypothetical protein